MAIRMSLQVSLKLLAPVAVLHGVPESKIESFRGFGVAGLGGECAAASSRVRASEAKGALRILLERRRLHSKSLYPSIK